MSLSGGRGATGEWTFRLGEETVETFFIPPAAPWRDTQTVLGEGSGNEFACQCEADLEVGYREVFDYEE